MSGVFTEALSASVTQNSQSRFIGSQYAGLQVNQLMFTVTMTPALEHEWNIDDLDEFMVSCNFRRKDADNVQLLDNCRLGDMFKFSDFMQGVSIGLENELAPKGSPLKISGSLGFGYFSLGADESVELMITGKPQGIGSYASIQIDMRWVYVAQVSQKVYGYKSFTSAGGEQAYRDVLTLYYIGAPVNKSVTIRDYMGSQSVNLEDAVSLANAVGKFELFTNFGLVYSDPTQFTQDISLTLESEYHLFTQIEFFQINKLAEQNQKSQREQEAVLQGIYASRKEKFDVLQARGMVPSTFRPMVM